MKRILNIYLNETMTNYLAKIAQKKSLLKEFHNNQDERIVYLNDGDEFQISIFNPYSYVIGVAFSFNSNDVDKSKLLVLKPCERIWLERYLESNNKFVFNTYEVEASKEVKKAIKNNGVLNVYFYNEIKKRQANIVTTYPHITWEWNYNDIYQDNTALKTNFYNSISATSANYSTHSSTCTLPFDTCLTAASLSAFSENIKVGTNSCVNKNIETGRIEKGSYSNQDFKNYYGDFDNYAFKTETIKLLPMSQKQISSNDLKKKYCHNCGKKIKANFKFCPNCGAEQ